MNLNELKEMIIYIIKRDTFFSRDHAERVTEEILDQVKEYMKEANNNVNDAKRA